MRNPARGGPVVALIAAYAVALQGLLWPLALAAGHPLQTSLCSEAAATSGTPAPARHDNGCPCAAGCGMQCCVQTFVGPPQTVIALQLTRAVAMTPAPVLAPVVRLADRSPQVPRAPPAL
jgi:hypothetical protein